MTSSGVVVVVGSLNVDLTFRVARLPAPGQTVVGARLSTAHGGKGANQAAAAAAFGARTFMIGRVGNDDGGRDTRTDLARRGVDTSLVVTGEGATGMAAIFTDRDGENLIAVASGANADLSAAAVTEALATIEGDPVIVLACLEVPDAAVAAAAAAARDREWSFLLNPAPARPLRPDIVAACDVLVPNQHEVGALGYRSVQDLLDRGAGAVVVTRGAAGAELVRPDLPALFQPAFAVESIDTTGAGDAFCGTFAAALAEGRALDQALRAACAAGALATRAIGARASLASRAEIDQLLGA